MNVRLRLRGVTDQGPEQQVVKGDGYAPGDTGRVLAILPTGEVGLGPAGLSGTYALSTVRFVDVDTTCPLAEQNGNEQTPFASLQAAITAAASLPAPATILCVPSPTSYGDIVLPPASNIRIMQLGLPEPGRVTQGFAGADAMTLGNVTSGGGGALLGIYGANVAKITGQDNSETISLGQCTVAAQVPGVVSNPTFLISDSRWTGNLNHSALTAANTDFSVGVIAADTNGASVSFSEGCTFTMISMTQPAGALYQIPCDLASFTAMQLNLIAGGPLTNYTLSAGLTRRSFRLSVIVPAVLAGQVDYVNKADVQLACMQEEQPILVNPTADLVAAGAGGGFINARMVNDGGIIKCRLAFLGPLAGGASNFMFTVV